jgi:uncharacterized membrane-anchored protein YhcB (DUF1043 family)
MPQSLLAWIPLIAAGVTSGTSLGLTLSGAGQPSQGALLKEEQQMQLQQQQQQQQKQEQELFKHFAPDVQSATGGALADRSFSDMVAELSGSGSDLGLAQQTIFGNQQPGLASG